MNRCATKSVMISFHFFLMKEMHKKKPKIRSVFLYHILEAMHGTIAAEKQRLKHKKMEKKTPISN